MPITAGLVNWGGNVRFAAHRVHRPADVAELQQLVADARSVRALGSAHSFSRIADTTGELVDVSGLPDDIVIDDASATADVPAGIRYAELAPHLHARGFALPNLGSLPHISLAGSYATGTHGSGMRNRVLATSAVGVDYVRGDGELVVADSADPGFAGSVLALGALGVATRLRLQLVPAFDIAQRVWLDAALPGVVASLPDILGAGYSVSLFSTTTRPEVVDQIWVKSLADDPVPDMSRWAKRPATGPMHPILGMDTAASTEQGGRPGPWHDRLPHFRADHVPSGGQEQQTEYLLPAENGPEALDRVHRLGLGDVLMCLEIRAIAADDLWLSPCRDRDTVAVHFTWRNDDDAVVAAVDRVEAALAPLDPRPHWGKVFRIAPDVVRENYPRLRDFAELVERDDPQHKFGNDFLERFVY